MFRSPQPEEVAAVRNELFSPLIVPPVLNEEEEDNTTIGLAEFLEDLSSDEESVPALADPPLILPPVRRPSERPLVPYWYLRRQVERH